jgi:hypothetical protein
MVGMHVAEAFATAWFRRPNTFAEDTSMKNEANGSAIVIGRQSLISSGIRKMLKPYFRTIYFLSDLQAAMTEVADEQVRLILLIDHEKNETIAEVARASRRAFPSAKILGLFDAFNPEQEVVLRTAGVVFLGSYERFARNSRTILTKALNSALF